MGKRALGNCWAWGDIKEGGRKINTDLDYIKISSKASCAPCPQLQEFITLPNKYPSACYVHDAVLHPGRNTGVVVQMYCVLNRRLWPEILNITSCF